MCKNDMSFWGCIGKTQKKEGASIDLKIIQQYKIFDLNLYQNTTTKQNTYTAASKPGSAAIDKALKSFHSSFTIAVWILRIFGCETWMACRKPVTAVFPFFAGRVVLPLWLPFVTFDFFCPGLVSLFRLFPPFPPAFSSSSFLSLLSDSSFFSLYISLIPDGKRAKWHSLTLSSVP